MSEFIEVKGAKENNLNNISVRIPKNKLVVLTGLSGSGKSTFALDTLQKECQRQYMESMGMVTDFVSKPKVDSIIGLSPSISIDQRNNNRNPRSTVGTITEIFTYLRILYAKLGVRVCPKCNKTIKQNFESDTSEESYDEDLSVQEEASIYERNETMTSCPHCGEKVVELSMSHFSFNKPEGACPTCKGIGTVSTPNLAMVFDDSHSVRDGAIKGWDKIFIDRYAESIENAGKHYGFEISADTPICEYSDIHMKLLLYGVEDEKFYRHFPDRKSPKTVPLGKFEGIITNLMRRFSGQTGDGNGKLEKLFVHKHCPDCNGNRLRKESVEVTIGGVNIIELCKKSLYELKDWIDAIPTIADKEAFLIAKPILDDLQVRTARFLDVGIGYLSMERSAPTLSAGEAQRLRLASILGSGLTGVLYVLDEPTTGLHASDTEKLIKVLMRLRDIGNTVLVIEHDVEMMLAADHIIDFGPGAGKNGGNIVTFGTPQEVAESHSSITGRHISGADRISVNLPRRIGNGKSIKITGACEHNLKNVDIAIPLGKLVSVTGVSGSGKSTLVFDILKPASEAFLHKTVEQYGKYKVIEGLENITDVITINQEAVGRTTRSNAATYTDIFGLIRDLFASLKDAKSKGLGAKHFSFNVAGGRCEKCQGAGELSISMHFLPDVQVKCPVCHGKRFQKHVLDVNYKGYSIADVLNLSVDEALAVFCDIAPIADKLSILKEVGLGYLSLGQPATTLSGGEAQRIKLAKELSKQGKGHTLYLLDEPTTGLHPHDVHKLIRLFERLIDAGHSVITVEHNTDVITMSDWVIDFGPDGGSNGGTIIAQGTPEKIAEIPVSKTGVMLAKMFSDLS